MCTGVVLFLNHLLWPHEQVIIDPSWLARVMASVVTFVHNAGKRTGLMSIQELQQIWGRYELLIFDIVVIIIIITVAVVGLLLVCIIRLILMLFAFSSFS